MNLRRARWAIPFVALSLVAAACGNDDDAASEDTVAVEEEVVDDTAAVAEDEETDATDEETDTAAEPVSLKNVCPDPLIIQTDWFPEPDHGYSYQAIGPDGTLDAKKGSYSGPLRGSDITLEVRAGGPFISFAAPTQQMYQDPAIFMAYVDTGDSIRNAGKQPTVAVFASYEKGPQIIMWDPEKHPDVETIEDIGAAAGNGKILYFKGAAYMDYLLGKGVLKAEQTDSSYNGAPDRFVTESDLFQQGFATNEPFKYENDIEQWKKPVKFALIHDTGFAIYQSALSVKPAHITERAECLKAVVPLFQQAQVDYMADPEPMNKRFVEIVEEIGDPGWTLSEAGNADAVERMRDLGLVSNGDNAYVGDMDCDRIQTLIDEFNPIAKAAGVEGVKDGLTCAEIATNEFLDQSIGLS